MNIDNSLAYSTRTGAVNTPIPVYKLCGLKSPKELANISNGEIIRRIRDYYSVSH